jgi:ribonuclease E
MDERKNNAAVEKRVKDKLKTDRARIQVGRISGFGLMEMSRQRLRPGMLEASTQPCPSCHGTGLIRSDDSMALSILRQIEEEGTRQRSREVLIKAPVGIANFLMNQKREHIAQIEARYGLSVRIEGDPLLISPDFSMEKFKTATRVVQAREEPILSVDASLMDDIDAEDTETNEAADTSGSQNAQGQEAGAGDDGDGKPKRRRRRRRRGRGKGGNNGDDQQAQNADESGQHTASQGSEAAKDGESARADEAEKTSDQTAEHADTPQEEAQEKPKRTRSRSRKKVAPDAADGDANDASEGAAAPEVKADSDAAENAEAPPAKPKRTRRKKAEASSDDAQQAPAAEDAAAEASSTEPAEEKKPEPVAAQAEAAHNTDVVTAQPEPISEAAPEKPAKPKKRGWWSLGG